MLGSLAALFAPACVSTAPATPPIASVPTSLSQPSSTVASSQTVRPTPNPVPPPTAVPKAAASPVPAAVSPVPAAKSVVANIDLGDNFFSPDAITVTVGTTVVWHHRGEGEMPHDVVATDKSFNSGDLRPTFTFSYTFTQPGRYTYVCTFHVREMTAEIIVE